MDSRLEQLDIGQWAWEFLRRNPAYQADYREFITAWQALEADYRTPPNRDFQRWKNDSRARRPAWGNSQLNTRRHLIMFLAGFLGWLFFFLLGYPSNYFTKWSFAEQVMLSLITFFSVVPCLGSLAIVLLGGNYLQSARWLAFYTSVPLFVFVSIVVGIVQGQGLAFLKSHWYITIGYFFVWIELPLIGLALRHFADELLKQREIA